ncbi:hypothetical protein JOL62DRAFT_562849 [Phyllosticta paracitricarpa]|uniref:PHD-type domain-containing protein n=1 Tax=Phyllosticta paracitricarpa TaxID=2016321 RepID=A0ABR1NJ17_9PEZI
MADADMADAQADMASSQQQAQSHPDAQATVTDFLDYTEFYPSDLIRSMTLIEKLDKLYNNAAARVHDLTTLYGKLPTLPPAERPDPTTLRRQISEALNEAERARESSFAEAARLYENTERHATRLVTIKKKLQALPEPPSRDPTPAPAPSPHMSRTRKQESDRTPRIMLHMDAPRARPTSTARVQKHRERKRKRAQQAALGVIPGQVLPDQGDAGSPQPSNASDSDEERSISPSEARLNQTDAAGEIITDKAGIKQPKIKGPKLKGPKPPREPRPPGMGTNVHSQIAGISTSNALAQLTPPPPDARPGTRHAPWHKLTEYEMAVLRKTMKKNAIWQPSDTMIRRELSSKGRGWENYKKAKEHADKTGEPFIDESPMDPNKEVLDPGETSFKPLGKEDNNLINRGMKLNEMKKLKREATLREQAARDAMEIEDASRRVADAGAVIKTLFDGPAPTPIAVSKDKARSARKRKRDSTPDITKVNGKEDVAQPPDTASRPPGPKKLKLAPPAPPKSNENTAAPSPVNAQPEEAPEAPKASNSQVPLAQPRTSTSRAPSIASGRNASPALPSPVESNVPPNPPPNATAAASRSRRASTAPQYAISNPGDGAAAPVAELHRATSRAMSPAMPANTSQTLPRTRHGTSAKAASEEAPVKRELRELRDVRRASNVSLPSAAEHQATAPVVTAAPAGTRTSGRRSKRPAPGPITAEGHGKNKVVVGKRTAAPKKKGNKKSEEKNDGGQGANQHGDDWAEDIDPNEERYCICGDVSYGVMIACENEENCEKEWFHLPCVGLADIPKRREKWYCPDCRSMLKIDEKGNPVDAVGGGAGRR